MRSILDISQASRRSVCVPFVRHPLISTFSSLSSQSLHTFTCLSVCCVCPVSQGDLLLTAELWPLRGVAIVLVCVAFNSTQNNFGFVLVTRLAFSGSHTINSRLPFSQYPPSVGAAKRAWWLDPTPWELSSLGQFYNMLHKAQSLILSSLWTPLGMYDLFLATLLHVDVSIVTLKSRGSKFLWLKRSLCRLSLGGCSNSNIFLTWLPTTASPQHTYASVKKGMFELFRRNFKSSCKCHPDVGLWHFSVSPHLIKDRTILPLS